MSARRSASLQALLLALLLGAPAAGQKADPPPGKPVKVDRPRTAVYLKNSGCSAVIVGPHVLLTAAHCVPNGLAEVPRFLHRAKEPGRCQRQPDASDESRGRGSCGRPARKRPPGADLALCVFGDPAFPADYRYQILATKAPAPGTLLTFVGFGCTGTGSCEAAGTSASSSSAQQGTTRMHLVASDATWITEADLSRGDAGLCAGDSGGPVFLGPDGRRVVAIAKASCIGWRIERSAVTPLGTPSTVDWMCRWTRQDPHRREILGLACPR